MTAAHWTPRPRPRKSGAQKEKAHEAHADHRRLAVPDRAGLVHRDILAPDRRERRDRDRGVAPRSGAARADAVARLAAARADRRHVVAAIAVEVAALLHR